MTYGHSAPELPQRDHLQRTQEDSVSGKSDDTQVQSGVPRLDPISLALASVTEEDPESSVTKMPAAEAAVATTTEAGKQIPPLALFCQSSAKRGELSSNDICTVLPERWDVTKKESTSACMSKKLVLRSV